MEEREKSGVDALSVFLMGFGVLLLILGPCADIYSMSYGLIGLVASWVFAITIRVFFFGGESSDNRRNRRYY
jgi:uncharacterized membrane protein YuzA (DUF378 family)